MGLSFIVAAGPRHRIHSQVLVPRDTWLHCTVSDSRLLQPGGPGPRIYIPQEQGEQVITPDTGFPFRRLLRLAELRWRNSNPPTHGLELCWKSKSKLCYDRRSVGQTVLVSSTHLKLTTRFLLMSDNCGFVDVGRPLWREDGSVFYYVQYVYILRVILRYSFTNLI
jgi:hypothetical protein